jgi:hypothetical protein
MERGWRRMGPCSEAEGGWGPCSEAEGGWDPAARTTENGNLQPGWWRIAAARLTEDGDTALRLKEYGDLAATSGR